MDPTTPSVQLTDPLGASAHAQIDPNLGAGERRPSRLLAVTHHAAPEADTGTGEGDDLSTPRVSRRRTFWLKPKRIRTTLCGAAGPPSEVQEGTLTFDDDDHDGSRVSFRDRWSRRFGRKTTIRGQPPQAPPALGRQDAVVDEDETEEEIIEPEFQFKFLPPEEEPKMRKDVQERAVKAVRNTALKLFADLEAMERSGPGDGSGSESGEDEEGGTGRRKRQKAGCGECVEALKNKILSKTKAARKSSSNYISSLTPELKKASSEGLKMMTTMFFPAMPNFLQDLWVFLEFAVTVISFVLGFIGFSVREDTAFNVIYVILGITSFILALIDGYIYFFQLSNFTRCYKGCISKFPCCKRSVESSDTEPLENGERRGSEATEQEGETEQENEGRKRRFWQLSDKMKERLETWFELIRTLTSEAILYPLLVCDLFGFITEVNGVSEELQADSVNRLDFSLFVIGNIYMVIAVYFMRLFMLIGTFIQIRRIPALSSGSSDNVKFIGRFCIHVIGQVIIHALIIIALSAKIHHENPGDGDSIRVSPFLWLTIIIGGILPLSGIAIFFLNNYYYTKQMSISFWLDMLSLLQGEGFSDVAFGGEGSEDAKSKSMELAEKSGFSKVKKQFSQYKTTPAWIKATYPLRLPLLVVLGLLYDFAIFVFLGSLLFSTDPDTNEVEFVLFDNAFLTTAFCIMCVSLAIANARVLLLMNLFILVMAIIFVLIIIAAALFSPFFIVFYLPYIICGTCLHSILPKIL